MRSPVDALRFLKPRPRVPAPSSVFEARHVLGATSVITRAPLSTIIMWLVLGVFCVATDVLLAERRWFQI